jgi:uncharacterized protein YbjT (DUF2867 family)
MVVLLTGATGFIGRRLAAALADAGHDVICAVRAPEAAGDLPCKARVAADLASDVEPADWLPRLVGVEAVINAAGIFREHGRATFDRVHVRGPHALFVACVMAGVRRVVHVSALGADEHARTGFHVSKRTADGLLLGLPLDAVVVQPSLVYGDDGASARAFTTLATMPLVPVPGRGLQRIQPVHVDDVVAGIVALLAPGAPGGRVPFVGPEPLALCDYLRLLRRSLGLGDCVVVPVPRPLVRAAARATRGRVPLLDTDALAMLDRDNVADPAPLARLLGCPPRSVEAFVPTHDAAAVRRDAQLRWLLPTLRASVAAVWIVTGLLSLGLYPREASYALLARAGVPEALAPLLLYGGAVLDLALGVATLALRERRVLWMVQIAVIILYTAIITVRLPEYWLHPFGPVLKNLPMLAAIGLLLTMERR